MKKGFTLIELLVVISIIGILMAISFVGFTQSRKSARDTKRKADLEQIRSALEIYRNDQKTYPAAIDFDQALSLGGETYMEKVPQDPQSPTSQYQYTGSTNSYCICAFLETLTATVGTCDCGGDCGTDIVCNYKVANP